MRGPNLRQDRLSLDRGGLRDRGLQGSLMLLCLGSEGVRRFRLRCVHGPLNVGHARIAGLLHHSLELGRCRLERHPTPVGLGCQLGLVLLAKGVAVLARPVSLLDPELEELLSVERALVALAENRTEPLQLSLGGLPLGPLLRQGCQRVGVLRLGRGSSEPQIRPLLGERGQRALGLIGLLSRLGERRASGRELPIEPGRHLPSIRRRCSGVIGGPQRLVDLGSRAHQPLLKLGVLPLGGAELGLVGLHRRLELDANALELLLAQAQRICQRLLFLIEATEP